MKKIYSAPQTYMVNIEISSIMQAASNGTLDKSQTISSSDGFGSRRNDSFWEDED